MQVNNSLSSYKPIISCAFLLGTLDKKPLEALIVETLARYLVLKSKTKLNYPS